MRYLFSIVLVAVTASPALSRSTTPVLSKTGMVAADHKAASQAGAKILSKGGDAVDAAVATTLMLGVVSPFASGIGGGGFAVVHRHDGRRYTLDFREVAPSKASRDMFLGGDGKPIPNASRRGPRAAGVPGELAGLAELHRRHGKLPWKAVVAPALKAAKDGFTCGQFLHMKIVEYQKELAQHPHLAAIFLTREGHPVSPGTLIKRPNLARTLSLISEQGPTVFYRGEIAQAIAHSMTKDGGLITQNDLKKYSWKDRKPVVAEMMGLTLLSMAPPSSGGAVIIQVLKALDLNLLKQAGHNSDEYIHRVVEALKHGFADRANIMGDPDFVDVPLKAMLSDRQRDRIRKAFNPKMTLKNGAYGGRYASPRDGGTSHLSVLDGSGNAVALTTTINTSFGSLYMAGNTGILMNNEMDDFVVQPGVPNAFGLIGRESNAVSPGKRPLSSMSPTIVLKNTKPLLVLGASGGPTIITGTLQVLLNIILFEQNVQAAINTPRFHHQWQPDLIFVEPGFSASTIQGLKKRGHTIKIRARFNAVQAIQVRLGRYEGGADYSKLGVAAGVGGHD